MKNHKRQAFFKLFAYISVNPFSFAVKGTLILPITLIFAKKGYSPRRPSLPLASVSPSPQSPLHPIASSPFLIRVNSCQFLFIRGKRDANFANHANFRQKRLFAPSPRRLSRLFASVASSPPRLSRLFASVASSPLRLSRLFASVASSPLRLSRLFASSPQSPLLPFASVASLLLRLFAPSC
jgi:hypothetical protein